MMSLEVTTNTPPRIGAEWPEQGHFIYAGVMRGRNGAPDYHLLVHPDDKSAINWTDAKAWASDLGCELPFRAEQSLLFANVPELFERDWYWSSEEHASNSDYAWVQNFNDGNQSYYHKGVESRARAVRRFEIFQNAPQA